MAFNFDKVDSVCVMCLVLFNILSYTELREYFPTLLWLIPQHSGDCVRQEDHELECSLAYRVMLFRNKFHSH